MKTWKTFAKMFDDDKKMTIMMWNFTNVLDDWHRNHNVLQKRKAKIRENKIITKKREDKRKRKKQRRQRRVREVCTMKTTTMTTIATMYEKTSKMFHFLLPNHYNQNEKNKTSKLDAKGKSKRERVTLRIIGYRVHILSVQKGK